jgi:phospholipase B1
VCFGASCPALQFLPDINGNNAASSSSLVSDIGADQLNYLIRQVNQNPLIDVANDWKLLTIMIGTDDLCASCTFNETFLDPNDYQNNLMAALERVRTSLPRTFVNLVGGYNISQAYQLSLQIDKCTNISRPLFIECDCLFQPENADVRQDIDSAITEFNVRAQNIASYYQHQGYDSFAVVYQPFLSTMNLTDMPIHFLSPTDCFHPSSRAQSAMAIGLWNNMLTPAADKKTSIDMFDEPLCPTPDTLLYTY